MQATLEQQKESAKISLSYYEHRNDLRRVEEHEKIIKEIQEKINNLQCKNK